MPRRDWEALRRYDPERAPVRLDLSDNTNLWGTHPEALERVRSATVDDLARYPSLYADTLRDAVGERFDVDPACVTTGAGSDDVLDSAFRAAYAPGGRVAFAAPTFSMIEPFAIMNGMEPIATPWSEAEEDPEALLRCAPDVVYVCRPNNPTGASLTRAWIDDLLAARGPGGPLVVVDEAYADFVGETLLAEAPGLSNVLVARTASKAYGLAGMRCGYAVASPEVALEVEKSRGPYKVATLASEAAAAAVLDRSGWMAGCVRTCVDNRTRLRAELERRGHRTLDSTANFLLFAAPTGAARPDALLLRSAGVGVRPFSGIPEIEEGLRVTVGPWELMEEFLEVLTASFCPGGGS
jgi:histidinol-phosphate aminotransferase